MAKDPLECGWIKWSPKLVFIHLPITKIIIHEEPKMIVKSGRGYKVKSEGGKNLSKGGLSKKAAEKRLRQVEYWKNKKK